MELKKAILTGISLLFLPTGAHTQMLSIHTGGTKVPPYHFEASARQHSMLSEAIRGSLLYRGEGFNLEPGHLSHFEYSFKDDSYILRLRDNLRFHNGRNVTIVDLEFAITRGFFSNKPNFFSARFGEIKGVGKIKPGTKFTSGKIEGITILDENTLKIKLNAPNPSFLHNLTSPYYSLIPIESLKEDYLSWKTKPIGAGKYAVESIDTKEQHMTLKRDDTISEKPTRILVSWNGSISKATFDISFEHLDGYQEYVSQLPVMVKIIEFSNVNTLGSNPSFKKLTSEIIKQSPFIASELGIKPADQVLPSHFWGRATTITKSTTQAVKSLAKPFENKTVKAALFSGKPISKKNHYYVRELISRFKEFGINLIIETTENKFFDKHLCEKYSFFISGKVVDYTDPIVMFGAYRTGGHDPFLAPTEPQRKRFDILYRQCATSNKSPQQRANCVKELSQFTYDNNIVLALSEEPSLTYYNKKTIKTLGKQTQPLTLRLDNILTTGIQK